MPSAAAQDRKTAHDWLRRALLSYQRYRASGKPPLLARAAVEADEALEHAAKVGDHGRLVGIIQRKLDKVAKVARP